MAGRWVRMSQKSYSEAKGYHRGSQEVLELASREMEEVGLGLAISVGQVWQ